MRILSIDRFDGKYAICEDDEMRAFAINISEIPKDAKEGTVIIIDDDGEIRIDHEETNKRRKKIKKLQDEIWSN